MNIGGKLKNVVIRLEKAEIESAPLEAELLLSYILKKPREFLYAYPEKKISIFCSLSINNSVRKRLSGLSLAAITGQRGFYGLNFIVNKNVLIPRPETELIVEEVCKTLNYQGLSTVIDIGTGSGCIIITLAKLLKQRNDIRFYGLDISKRLCASPEKIPSNSARLTV